jgi:hypothetical protein
LALPPTHVNVKAKDIKKSIGFSKNEYKDPGNGENSKEHEKD